MLVYYFRGSDFHIQFSYSSLSAALFDVSVNLFAIFSGFYSILKKIFLRYQINKQKAKTKKI